MMAWMKAEEVKVICWLQRTKMLFFDVIQVFKRVSARAEEQWERDANMGRLHARSLVCMYTYNE